MHTESTPSPVLLPLTSSSTSFFLWPSEGHIQMRGLFACMILAQDTGTHWWKTRETERNRNKVRLVGTHLIIWRFLGAIYISVRHKTKEEWKVSL